MSAATNGQKVNDARQQGNSRVNDAVPAATDDLIMVTKGKGLMILVSQLYCQLRLVNN